MHLPLPSPDVIRQPPPDPTPPQAAAAEDEQGALELYGRAADM
eukprot:CAMPEP_0119471614 /NCGR_PEP_ID=MMETSP1344-20130328/4004_1 /TAXON_ID=236787 /ORGANISM="Florenciella parvula, Strain CCMP2471" /LENGTH=42 /DNA_ID= /DNA_START= /DNA_END= /DNA_ORIENTATION=